MVDKEEEDEDDAEEPFDDCSLGQTQHSLGQQLSSQTQLHSHCRQHAAAIMRIKMRPSERRRFQRQQ